VLELKDKVGAVAGTLPGTPVPAPVADRLIDALAGLGFTARQAADAVAAVTAEAGDGAVASGDEGVLLRRAIATGDYPALTKVPGIGRKGAEKIVVELRDRVGAIDGGDGSAALAGVTAIAPWKDQVLHALAGLGFTGKEAAEAIDAVAADSTDNPEVSVILRRAIQLLGRTR
jgi:Holliday junction DNA helicase RuvA